MNLRNLFVLIVCISLPLLLGTIAGFITSSNIETWYVGLTKPHFNPPNWLFGPVWTMLYILMGISLYRIVGEAPGEKKKVALRAFFIQLGLNFAWSFIFFYYHQTGLALFEIVILWLAILAMIVSFYRLNHLSAYLQLPYLLWVTFATVLNASIWYLNK